MCAKLYLFYKCIQYCLWNILFKPHRPMWETIALEIMLEDGYDNLLSEINS